MTFHVASTSDVLSVAPGRAISSARLGDPPPALAGVGLASVAEDRVTDYLASGHLVRVLEEAQTDGVARAASLSRLTARTLAKLLMTTKGQAALDDDRNSLGYSVL